MLPLIDAVTQEQVLRALDNGEIRLYYQPLYNFKTKQFETVEALLRWQHPTYGLLLPETFLMQLDAIGMSVIVGDWVLKHACEQFKAWVKKGVSLKRVAVNLNERQLREGDFVERVASFLKNNKMHGHQLELEITENIQIRETDVDIIDALTRLKAMGVHIALDDFGIGNSSINHIKHIPVDRIKIDKSYILNIKSQSGDASIVQGFIDLAKRYHLEVVVEGVETYPQLVLLLLNEGLTAQGHYFSLAIPAKDAGDFLRYYQQHPFPLIG